MEGIHHVSLEVTDIKKAKQFYENVLGLETSSERPAFDFEGAWYNIGSTQIHLIESPNLNKAERDFTSRDAHFAIRVKNLVPLLKKFDDHHVKYLNKPTSKTGWHQVFVQDPDGNVIEFHQII
jgi:glyoxylase I family protein